MLTSDDGSWYNKTTDSKPCDDQDWPKDVHVVRRGDSHGTCTGSHEAAGDDQHDTKVTTLEVG